MTPRDITHTTVTFLSVCLALAAVSARFVLLDYSPPGFFVDEAGSAAHTVCLQNYHTNCDGISWPIYSVTWGHGRVGPVYQYSGWAWTSLFGGSISSFRAMSSFAGLLTSLIIALFARSLAGNATALWVFFAALLSPWSFHSSRVAWDPALAPLVLTVSIYFFFAARSSRYWPWLVSVSALACVLAFHTYAPAGAQLLILFCLVLLFQRYTVRHPLTHWILFASVTVILYFSIFLLDTSLVQLRASEVGIFGNDPRNPTAGLTWFFKIPQFLGNLLRHFSPSYLFIDGEFNLRHTVSGFGILSWLDIFAIVAGLLVFIYFRRVVTGNVDTQATDSQRHVLIYGILGYLSATISAALTWDSIPHALRSIGGWPFVALISGVCLAYITRYVYLRILTLCVAAFFAYVFSFHYFNKFISDAAWWFDSDVTKALHDSLDRKDPQSWDDFTAERHYPLQAKKYFDIEYFSRDLRLAPKLPNNGSP